MRQEGKTAQNINELMCMVDQGVPQVTVMSRTKLYQDEVIRPRILHALKKRGITWVDLPNDSVLTESKSGTGTRIVFKYQTLRKQSNVNSILKQLRGKWQQSNDSETVSFRWYNQSWASERFIADLDEIIAQEHGLCKTCEYYQPSKHFIGTLACTSPKMRYGYLLEATEPDQVLIEDDEGWGMRPGPDFGCIHHKEK